MIKEYNFDEFEKVSKNDWTDKLKQDLGEDLAQRISTWDCERELSLSAYYDQNDSIKNIKFPTSANSDWGYLQTLKSDSSNEQALDALMNGADGLILNEANIQNIEKVLSQVKAEYCALAVNTNSFDVYNRFATWWEKSHPVDGNGTVLFFNNSKNISSTLSIENISFLDKVFEKGSKLGHRTIHIDCGVVQRNGGSTALELGYMLSQAVYLINHFLDQGCDLRKVTDAMFISTSIGSGYFLELSKVRVMRLLMAELLKQYGVTDPSVVIHASTSPLTKSVIDSNTNFLRCTSEAMSAVLGGVNYLTIEPHHGIDSADRIARNLSNLLKEESYLSKVSDPAMGSYYIDQLSTDLAERAWKKFQEIEKNGGFEVAVNERFFQEEIEKDGKFQQDRIMSGRRKMVGVNDFGNADESISFDRLSHDYMSLADPFEKVRREVENHTHRNSSKSRPTVYLLAVGSNAKMINARYTFVTNFFNWAGFKVEKMDSSQPLSELHVIVCCGADEDYTDANINQALTDIESPGIVLAAGRSDTNSSSQITEWINARSNRLTTVTNVLSQLGITSNPSLP